MPCRLLRRTVGSILPSLALFALLTGSVRAEDPPSIMSISKPGPLTGELGRVAKIEVPEGYLFVPQANIRKFNQLTRNPSSPNELGAIVPTNGEDWWIVFAYNDEGYIKDDEKDKLDADAILKAREEMQVEGNKVRQQQGMKPLTLRGWEKPPYYDPKTHNLTWGLKLTQEGQEGTSINHEARLLGRGGSMSAILIVGSKDYAKAVPSYDQLLTGFSFTPGNTYSEWKPGDKVAEYGLAALAAGGVLAVAAKTGLLGKFLKPIIAALVFLGGGIAAFFRRLFGRKQNPTESA